MASRAPRHRDPATTGGAAGPCGRDVDTRSSPSLSARLIARRVAHMASRAVARRAAARTSPPGRAQARSRDDAYGALSRHRCAIETPASASRLPAAMTSSSTGSSPDPESAVVHGQHRALTHGRTAARDVFSRRSVGRWIADDVRLELVVAPLQMARWNPGAPVGTVLHSDRGHQYTSWTFGHRLREAATTLLRRRSCRPGRQLDDRVVLVPRCSASDSTPGADEQGSTPATIFRADRSVPQPHPPAHRALAPPKFEALRTAAHTGHDHRRGRVRGTGSGSPTDDEDRADSVGMQSGERRSVSTP